MNQGWKNKYPESNKNNTIINGHTSGSIRIISVLFWCFIYVGFFWFFDYRTDIEKLIGFTTLALGVVGVFLPVKAIGKKMWLGIIAAFYIGGFLFLGIMQ